MFRKVLLFTSLTVSPALLVAQTQSPPAQQNDQTSKALVVPGDVQILSDTMGVDFGTYLQIAVATIRNHWYSVMPEAAKPPTMKSGTVVIEFAILKAGKVSSLMVKQSSGDTSLDRAAWKAIADSEPFDRLPAEFSGAYLALRIKFLYNPEKAAPDSQPDQAQAKPVDQESTASPAPKKAPPAFNVPLSVDTILNTPPSHDVKTAVPSDHNFAMPPGIEILSAGGTASYDLKMFVQQRVARIVKQNWYERIPTKAKDRPLKRGYGAVAFSIMKDGSFSSVELADSTGDDEMDHAALEAVKASAPIPLPDNVSAQYVKLIIRFYYNPRISKWRK